MTAEKVRAMIKAQKHKSNNHDHRHIQQGEVGTNEIEQPWVKQFGTNADLKERVERRFIDYLIYEYHIHWS